VANVAARLGKGDFAPVGCGGGGLEAHGACVGGDAGADCARLGAGFGLGARRVWRWRRRGLSWRAEAGPGLGAPGLNVFVAGMLDGLHEGGLAEVGDDGGLFRCGGGQGSSQRDAEAGGGDAFAGECGGNVAADFLPGEVLGFAAGVIVAEIGVGGARHTAATAVAVSEQTQRRAVLGGMFGHG